MSTKSTPRRRRRRRSRTSRSSVSVAQHRLDAALAALSDNTRKAYRSAWKAWQRWSAKHRRSELPAATVDVAEYLQVRHAAGAAPATIHVVCAAIAKVHQVSGLRDPTTDSLCRDALRRICREGRDRGRGQVAGVGWAQVEEAAACAEGSGSLQGLRDGAILRLMSDTLARVSEVQALQCGDVEPDTLTSGGTVHIRASKTDQLGDGSTRYIGPATQRPKQRRGALCRQRPKDRAETHRGRDRRRGAYRRTLAAGGAARASWRPPAPAWRNCSRPAAGGRPLRRRSTFVARSPPAARLRGAATGWGSRGECSAPRSGAERSHKRGVGYTGLDEASVWKKAPVGERNG